VAEDVFDIVVLGAGAAGMAAAATAASLSKKVLLIDSSPFVGGTSALSAGSVWIPNSGLSGADSGLEAAKTYLDAVVGNWSSQAMRSAFLEHGPEMIAHLHRIGAIDLAPYPYHPDYLADAPGASTEGRALGTRAFDGRLLGKHLALLRPPMPEFTVFGGMMVDRTDLGHLLGMNRSIRSFVHSAGLVARYARDRLSGPRGRRLVMGNALAGRLLRSLLDRDVVIRIGTDAEALTVRDGRVCGLVVDGREVSARDGVIVATGGFSHHPELRTRYYPEPVAKHSAVPDANRGGGLDLMVKAGGHLVEHHANAAFWAPCSVNRRADGSLAVFPHFVLDRAKPGVIAVGKSGRRFVDESTSYQRFVEGMYQAGSIPCHLVCNGDFIRRNGLGIVRPGTRNPANFVQSNYLSQGNTLDELAARIGVDSVGLNETAALIEQYARAGVDPDFGRGGNAYARNLGDPAHGPNPCLGPIGAGPYYALEIHPGDIGTSIGIETNTSAQVLDQSGQPIAGLYAAGNDMSSVMGGVYPGPGITLGPAMTFGYVAAMHATSALQQETSQ